jgi:uncharacterized protein (TIGR02598 family)
MPHSRQVLHSKGNIAFTLVEVALAIAVVAVGLVGILALFPLGLRATRSATDDTQKASIAQDYIAYYQQLALTSNNYSSSDILANADYTSGATNDNIAYNVRVLVTNAGFPQITNSGLNLLSRVLVQVWRPGSKTNTYSTEVARYATP